MGFRRVGQFLFINHHRKPEFETFVWNIVNLERFISIFKVDTFKFKDKCLIPQLKLFLQVKRNSEVCIKWRSMLNSGIPKKKYGLQDTLILNDLQRSYFLKDVFCFDNTCVILLSLWRSFLFPTSTRGTLAFPTRSTSLSYII